MKKKRCENSRLYIKKRFPIYFFKKRSKLVCYKCNKVFYIWFLCDLIANLFIAKA